MRPLLLSLTVLMAATLAAPAGAAKLKATPKPGFYSAVPITYHSVTEWVIAGPFSATLDGKGTFDAFCVDLDHWNYWTSQYDVTSRSTDLLTHGPGIAWLYNHFDHGISNATQGAALQIAIWDVLVDNGDGLNAGLFQSSVTGAIANQVTSYLGQWDHHESDTRWFEANNHLGGRNQNLVGPPVPEPLSLGLLGLGALSLARRARRRRSPGE